MYKGVQKTSSRKWTWTVSTKPDWAVDKSLTDNWVKIYSYFQILDWLRKPTKKMAPKNVEIEGVSIQA